MQSAATYALICRIGKGSFGEVFKARNVETGADCVVKQIDLGLGEAAVQAAVNEVAILASLDSPHIVRAGTSWTRWASWASAGLIQPVPPKWPPAYHHLAIYLLEALPPDAAELKALDAQLLSFVREVPGLPLVVSKKTVYSMRTMFGLPRDATLGASAERHAAAYQAESAPPRAL